MPAVRAETCWESGVAGETGVKMGRGGVKMP